VDLEIRFFEEMEAMIAKAFGVESRAPAMLAIVGILVFGFNFAVGRIDVGPLLFLGALAVGLIVVAVVSVRRMSDRNESGNSVRQNARLVNR
jgi:hypothetical protein